MAVKPPETTEQSAVAAAAAPTGATKTCPFCSETIQAAAIKCRFCRSDLGSPANTATNQPSTPAKTAALVRPRRRRLAVAALALVATACLAGGYQYKRDAEMNYTVARVGLFSAESRANKLSKRADEFKSAEMKTFVIAKSFGDDEDGRPMHEAAEVDTLRGNVGARVVVVLHPSEKIRWTEPQKIMVQDMGKQAYSIVTENRFGTRERTEDVQTWRQITEADIRALQEEMTEAGAALLEARSQVDERRPFWVN